MQLRECYDSFGGSYEDVKKRIPKEEMIKKFAIKFLSETSYELLCRNLEKKDYEEAFRAAHSLKGVSQNLGFQRLGNSSSTMAELLRNSSEKDIDKDQCEAVLQQVTADYEEVTGALRKLED